MLLPTYQQIPAHTVSKMDLTATGSGFTTYCSKEFERDYLTADEIQHYVHLHNRDITFVWGW